MNLFVDIECYPNYFLIMFLSEDGERVACFERTREYEKDFDPKKLRKLIDASNLIGFNSNNYDIPMLTAAISGEDTCRLKALSDDIIETNIKSWTFYDKHKYREMHHLSHVDLIEVAPGQASLKTYMARMHSQKLQDLPYKPDRILTDQEMWQVLKYCRNDLLGTRELYLSLEKQLDLRAKMSREYGIDLRSKSDAQIAEAVLKQEYYRLTGEKVKKGALDRGSFKYIPPSYVRFYTDEMKEVFKLICDAEFTIDDKTGHVKMPQELQDLTITIKDTVYKIGIGGLHSQESEVSYVSDDKHIIVDRDVASYYPTMIINMGISPPCFGEHFTPIYQDILDRRLKAKHRGDKVTADSLKITLNGTFGKLSNKYSTLYTPRDMLRTTLTGQLSLLMLIEALEKIRIPVVSANTDGVVIKCPVKRYNNMVQMVTAWEKVTNLQTEETEYEALYSRDVNNYIAIKKDGTKRKGVYASPTLQKNPQTEIVVDAVVAYLENGTDPVDTITRCRDITKFVAVRAVRGGGKQGDTVLGKVVRWYYAENCTDTINYISNGNKVPKTFGARPIMDLPKDFPEDVDYQWYIEEAKKTLWDIAALPRPVLEKIPRKNSKAWKALLEEGKIVEDVRDDKGKYIWNKEIRDAAEKATGSCPVVVQQGKGV